MYKIDVLSDNNTIDNQGVTFQYIVPKTLLDLKNPSRFFELEWDYVHGDEQSKNVVELWHDLFVSRKTEKQYSWYFELIAKYYGIHTTRPHVHEVFGKVYQIVKDTTLTEHQKEQRLVEMKVPRWVACMNKSGAYQINDGGIFEQLLNAFFECWNSVLMDLDNQVFLLLTKSARIQKYGSRIQFTNIPFFQMTNSVVATEGASPRWVDCDHDSNAISLDPAKNMIYYTINADTDSGIHELAKYLETPTHTTVILKGGKNTSEAVGIGKSSTVLLDKTNKAFWETYKTKGFWHTQLFFKINEQYELHYVPLVIIYKHFIKAERK